MMLLLMVWLLPIMGARGGVGSPRMWRCHSAPLYSGDSHPPWQGSSLRPVLLARASYGRDDERDSGSMALSYAGTPRAMLLPKTVGFFFSFRVFTVLLSVRSCSWMRSPRPQST